jgi:hypothetical protein
MTKLKREEFDARCSKLAAKYKDEGWTVRGMQQLWRFAREIEVGDRIVANRGTHEVIGIGRVTGKYFFVPDQDFGGHRLPVEWYDLAPRAVTEGGWRRTLIELDGAEFEAIAALSPAPKVGPVPASSEFKTEDYVRAFEQARLAPNYVRMLRLHYLAPGREITATGMAQALGYSAHSAANLHYGTLGRLIGEQLGWRPLPENPILVLVTFARPGEEWHWVLRPEVARAIERLGWTGGLQEAWSLERCVEDSGLDKAELESWLRAIQRKKQAIIYGPPGTGKTFVARLLAKHLVGGGDGFSDLVQFHPAYAYEDFIQGIRPQPGSDGALTYPMVPGRFLDFCAEARTRKDACVLIIDEINRANLARVFGELMYLLEYRDDEIPLAGGGMFRIPENVLVIGTMNTADRSIALVDHALRRRFAFLALYPNYEVLRRYHAQTGIDVTGLIATLQQLNERIEDPHYAVGISFFLRENLHDEVRDIWRMEIEPYLEEYFFDRRDRVDEFRWDKVGEKVAPWHRCRDESS